MTNEATGAEKGSLSAFRRIFLSGLHYQFGRHPDPDFAVAFAAVHLAMPIWLLLLTLAHVMSRVAPAIEAVLGAKEFPLAAGVLFLIMHQFFAWTFGSTRQLNLYYTEFKKDERMTTSSTMFAFGPAIAAVLLLAVSLVLF